MRTQDRPAPSRRALLTGGSAAVLAGCATSPDAPVPQSVDVRDYGAVGDGRTDDTTAIRAALAEAATSPGHRVLFPGRDAHYLCGPITVPSHTDLAGDPGGSLRKRGGSRVWITTAEDARDITVRGFHLDASRVRSHAVIMLGSGTSSFALTDCTITGRPASPPIGVAVPNRASKVEVRGCTLDTVQTGVRLSGACRDISIIGCRIHRWQQRGIHVLASDLGAARFLLIDGNRIAPQAPGGTVRQPIQFNGRDTDPFLEVRVRHNTVRGTGSAYLNPRSPGTADLISLHNCHRFVVEHNTVSHGGDIGITVSQQCRDGTVRLNTCTDNNAAGICIGSGTSTYTRDIRVVDNICRDNGVNEAGYFKPPTRSGILVTNATQIVVETNTVPAGSGTTQTFGVAMTRGAQAQLRGNVHSRARSAEVHRAP